MKWQRIELQKSYVLHTRRYRETSLLVECFSRDLGRVCLIAKGVRQAKSKLRGLLQPFVPLLISWVGKTELSVLTHVENDALTHMLQGDQLLCAFYANELLLRLLHRDDPHPYLFDAYQKLLTDLMPGNEQCALRLFEKRLLKESGYAFSLTEDCKTNEPICVDNHYSFEPFQGLSKALDESSLIFSGESVLALANDELHPQHMKDAKRLMRLALGTLIGDKPLKSRELFIQETS